MRTFFRNNGLTIGLLALFTASITGQRNAGWYVANLDLARHGQAGMSLADYPVSPEPKAVAPPHAETGI